MRSMHLLVLFAEVVAAAQPKADGTNCVPRLPSWLTVILPRCRITRQATSSAVHRLIAVIRQNEAAGGEVEDAQTLVENADYPTTHFLIRELSSPAARSLCVSVGQHTRRVLALDRLSTIPGEQKMCATSFASRVAIN